MLHPASHSVILCLLPKPDGQTPFLPFSPRPMEAWPDRAVDGRRGSLPWSEQSQLPMEPHPLWTGWCEAALPLPAQSIAANVRGSISPLPFPLMGSSALHQAISQRRMWSGALAARTDLEGVDSAGARGDGPALYGAEGPHRFWDRPLRRQDPPQPPRARSRAESHRDWVWHCFLHGTFRDARNARAS